MRLQHISFVLAYLPIAITAFTIPTYHELNDICKAAGPNAYVAVKHANDVVKTYNYGECYPYRVDNSPSYLAVYCKNAYCSNCKGDDCTDRDQVRTVYKSMMMVDPWGFSGKAIGKGAICERLPETRGL
ncbi:hypothetical protein CJF32_00009277 [Rutstroemia sp. NJR-2017a WRK4]|nr:hypothetical protein CJF32_00009277 [Rutstroemia sp. NJR-2017a WRK4]